MRPMVVLQEQRALFANKLKLSLRAIEWLFAIAFGRKVSCIFLDNLTGDGGDGTRNFKDHVFAQVRRYFLGDTHFTT